MLMRPVWWRWAITLLLFAGVVVGFAHGGFGWFLVFFGAALLVGLLAIVIGAAVGPPSDRK
jgi:hypothetical protein